MPAPASAILAHDEPRQATRPGAGVTKARRTSLARARKNHYESDTRATARPKARARSSFRGADQRRIPVTGCDCFSWTIFIQGCPIPAKSSSGARMSVLAWQLRSIRRPDCRSYRRLRARYPYPPSSPSVTAPGQHNWIRRVRSRTRHAPKAYCLPGRDASNQCAPGRPMPDSSLTACALTARTRGVPPTGVPAGSRWRAPGWL